MKRAIAALALVTAAAATAMFTYDQPAAEAAEATLYKNPNCGCCAEYAAYLERNGINVAIEETADLDAVKAQAGVPEELAACHTMLIDDYVVEGHVPVDSVKQLLSQEPEIRGIALPGMPLGSPGMGGEKTEPFTIHAFFDGGSTVYAVE